MPRNSSFGPWLVGGLWLRTLGLILSGGVGLRSSVLRIEGWLAEGLV